MSEGWLLSIAELADRATERHERECYPAEISRLAVLSIVGKVQADTLSEFLDWETKRRVEAQEKLWWMSRS
jgi:hypothetical protein